MFEIECDKCGNDLIIDEQATGDEYLKDMDYLVDSAEEIIAVATQQYLIYKCLSCETIYKFTYKDWENRLRLKIASEIMEVRKQNMFKEVINPQIIKSDAKEYCGQCSGYFGDGNCLVDVVKQCTIRKK